MGALDGIRVLDFSRLFPGHFCSTMLADHGADVLVVEAPWFREESVLGDVPMIRRNKRHMALDIRTEKGRQIFLDLASRSDVLIEGFRPGVMKKLGVDYQSVSHLNRRIVYCSITGYGQEGPLAPKAGHDLNYMAQAGFLDLLRDQDHRPVMPGFQISDLAGSLYATLGILLALQAREKTNTGQHVDAAITDGLLSLLAVPISFSWSKALLPGRLNQEGRDHFPCYNVYRTKDGEYISVGPLESHLWASLCEKLGCPQYSSLQYDRGSIEEITAHLQAIFISRELRDWTEFLNDPDDCIAPLVTVGNLRHTPHFLSRAMIILDETSAPQPGIAPKMSGTPGELRRRAYRFGEHSREILTELGYTEDSIADFISESVVWIMVD